MRKIYLLVGFLMSFAAAALGQVTDTTSCPQGPLRRIPITSLTGLGTGNADFMVLTDSCGNQYYTHKDSVTTAGDITNFFLTGDSLTIVTQGGDTLYAQYQTIVNQYFSGDTLYTIVQGGDTVTTVINNNITTINYSQDTLWVVNGQGDSIFTIINIDADTSGTGRFKWMDNFARMDTTWTYPAPATPDAVEVTNGLQIATGDPILVKLGGALIENTEVDGGLSYNMHWDSINLYRIWANSPRTYYNGAYIVSPWNANTGYIQMTSNTSFYMRADTVMQLDLFQHGATDSSHLLIRTSRLRKDLARNGSFLQMLNTTPGTYQGEADWSLYAFPTTLPDSAGSYALEFDGDDTFTWGEAGGGGDVDGSGTLDYLAMWTPDGATLGNSPISRSGSIIQFNTSPGGSTRFMEFWAATNDARFRAYDNESNIALDFYADSHFYTTGEVPNVSFGSQPSGNQTRLEVYGSTGSSGSKCIEWFNSALDSHGWIRDDHMWRLDDYVGISNTPTSAQKLLINQGNVSNLESIKIVNQGTGTTGLDFEQGSFKFGGTNGVYLAAQYTSKPFLWSAIGAGFSGYPLMSFSGNTDAYNNSSATLQVTGGGIGHIVDLVGISDTGWVASDLTLRIPGSNDTATVVNLWAGNAEGDLRKIEIGSGLEIQGDSAIVVTGGGGGGGVGGSGLANRYALWATDTTLTYAQVWDSTYATNYDAIYYDLNANDTTDAFLASYNVAQQETVLFNVGAAPGSPLITHDGFTRMYGFQDWNGGVKAAGDGNIGLHGDSNTNPMIYAHGGVDEIKFDPDADGTYDVTIDAGVTSVEGLNVGTLATGSDRLLGITIGGNVADLTVGSGLTISGDSLQVDGGVSGSGTLNYVAKWTPDGNTLGDSQIFDNGNEVSINGSPVASYELTVNGEVYGTNSGRFGNTYLNFGGNMLYYGGSSGGRLYYVSADQWRLDGGGDAIHFGINMNPDADASLSAQGPGNTIATSAAKFFNSDGDLILNVRDDKYVDVSNNLRVANGGTSLWVNPNNSRIYFYNGAVTKQMTFYQGRVTFGPSQNATPIRDVEINGGTFRVEGSVDTATVVNLWAGNAEGDLRKIEIGDGLAISGDSLTVTGGGGSIGPGTVNYYPIFTATDEIGDGLIWNTLNTINFDPNDDGTQDFYVQSNGTVKTVGITNAPTGAPRLVAGASQTSNGFTFAVSTATGMFYEGSTDSLRITGDNANAIRVGTAGTTMDGPVKMTDFTQDPTRLGGLNDDGLTTDVHLSPDGTQVISGDTLYQEPYIHCQMYSDDFDLDTLVIAAGGVDTVEFDIGGMNQNMITYSDGDGISLAAVDLPHPWDVVGGVYRFGVTWDLNLLTSTSPEGEAGMTFSDSGIIQSRSLREFDAGSGSYISLSRSCITNQVDGGKFKLLIKNTTGTSQTYIIKSASLTIWSVGKQTGA